MLEITEKWSIVCENAQEISPMRQFSSTTFGRGFELADGDAFATLASRILGDHKYNELTRRNAILPKGMANDRMVDAVMKVLNHPLVRLILGIVR